METLEPVAKRLANELGATLLIMEKLGPRDYLTQVQQMVGAIPKGLFVVVAAEKIFVLKR